MVWELVNAKEATLGGTSSHVGIVMLFFVSYIILVSYIMSSVVLAILIEKFEESRAQEEQTHKRTQRCVNIYMVINVIEIVIVIMIIISLCIFFLQDQVAHHESPRPPSVRSDAF